MTRGDKHLTYGDYRRDPKTHECRYCKGLGFRRVRGGIEVECTHCGGHGYVTSQHMTHVIKPKPDKDTR